jgi:hypothetical protein
MILYGSNRTVQYHRFEVVACPFGVHFCPAGKGASCAWHRPFSKRHQAIKLPRPNQSCGGPGRPGRRITLVSSQAQSGPQGRIKAGDPPKRACLVLTLICARLPWIPFAKFGFAFARGLPVRVCPFGGASAVTPYSVSKGQAGASMDIQSLGRR